MRGIGFQWLLGFACFAWGWGIQGAHADGPSVLKPELIPGSESVYRVQGRTVMQVTRGGEPSDQRIDTEQRFTVVVDLHEDEKSKKVRVTVNSVSMELEMPGMVMRYDSSDPATRDAMLGAAFKSLINEPVDMVYDETGAFVKMADTKAFGEGGNSPFGQAIGPEQVKQMVRSSLAEGFPEEVVSPGDSWTYAMAIPIPGMGELVFDMEYRYRNDRFIEERSCAIVDVKGTLQADSLKGPRGKPGEERRVDDGFEKGNLSGVVAVDKELRLIQESEFNLEMVMKMPSPLGRAAIMVPMRQEITTDLISFRRLR